MGCQLSKRRSRAYQESRIERTGEAAAAPASASPSKVHFKHLSGCTAIKVLTKAQTCSASSATHIDCAVVLQKPKACDEQQQACTNQQQLIKAGKAPTAADGKAGSSSHTATAPAAAAGKPKLNPKDFMFMQLTGKTHVKLPG